MNKIRKKKKKEADGAARRVTRPASARSRPRPTQSRLTNVTWSPVACIAVGVIADPDTKSKVKVGKLQLELLNVNSRSQRFIVFS